MGISVKDGAANHDPVSFEIIHKICASYLQADLRSANRLWITPDNRNYNNGLRLASTTLARAACIKHVAGVQAGGSRGMGRACDPPPL